MSDEQEPNIDQNPETVDKQSDNEPKVDNTSHEGAEAQETSSSGSHEAEPEEPVEMVEVPKQRLEELENAEIRFMEDLKRERAEGINYRKRLQKQRDEFAEIASAQILSKVLVAFDDLKRVIDNASDEIPAKHMQGIELVQQRLQGIFDQEGVSLIKIEEGKTRYDPMEMEAVVSQPIDGVDPNTVLGVISQGFKKGNRVLRPAKVMISKPVDPPKEEQKPSEISEEKVEDQKSDAQSESLDNQTE